MAYQGSRPVEQPAKGNAPSDASAAGNPTPAPTKPYENPSMKPRDFRGGVGQNSYAGPSSLAPGQTMTSPLADELRRVASKGDGGDALGEIIAHGTARRDDTITDQLRNITKNGVPAHPHMKNANDGGAPSGKVPSATGYQDGMVNRNPPGA